MKLWFERGAWASKRGKKVISSMSPDAVRRIVVIRHAALGDMVLVRPFLIEAREFFPNAEIILSIVSNYKYGVPDDLVDSIHTLPGSDQRGSPVFPRVSKIGELGSVDILFDLADTTRSRYLTWLAQAKLKIGFPYRWYLRNLLFDAAVFRSDFAFEAESMLDTLRLLGASPSSPLRFCWPMETQALLEGSSQKKIVYFPYASVSTKSWPKEKYAELIGLLAEELPDYSHTVLGGVGIEEDTGYFKTVLNRRGNIQVQPAMSLNLTIQFLSLAKLVISNDTGIRNLAIAANAPTLGIFFSTVPFRYWPRWDFNHEVVFVADGSLPSVDLVAAKARRILHLTRVSLRATK